MLPKGRWGSVLAKVKMPWQGMVLTAVLALSAFLNLSRLTSEGYANLYYAATVKNMLTSWHNFFFASYDAGFVSVDKPPLGFWIQATSAYLFGFHGWSILLPQALAGILCVALLYHLLSRSFGPVYANRLCERASPRQHCRTLRQDTTIPWLVSGCCAAR
jgi:4-amino-4-deoxy-L-arabinose transferase-like glycosyltransferase